MIRRSREGLYTSSGPVGTLALGLLQSFSMVQDKTACSKHEGKVVRIMYILHRGTRKHLDVCTYACRMQSIVTYEKVGRILHRGRRLCVARI